MVTPVGADSRTWRPKPAADKLLDETSNALTAARIAHEKQHQEFVAALNAVSEIRPDSNAVIKTEALLRFSKAEVLLATSEKTVSDLTKKYVGLMGVVYPPPDKRPYEALDGDRRGRGRR